MNTNFDIFGGSCTDPQGLHLQAKFHLNVFIVSASGGHKPQFLANFWPIFDIFGGSCTDPLLPMTTKFGVRGKKPQNRPLSKLNTSRLALRAMLPVTKKTQTDVTQREIGRDQGSTTSHSSICRSFLAAICSCSSNTFIRLACSATYISCCCRFMASFSL